MKKQLIPSVNYHLWQPCNFRCKFCYATFQDIKQDILPKGHLPKEQAIKVVESLAEAGFTKITFAGGEPTLCPWLSQLIIRAKEKGLTTMIVTNGSNLTDQFLENLKGYLDWVALSIDSAIPSTNKIIGRVGGNKNTPSANWYLQLGMRVRQFGYKLKINTVVNKYNYQEKNLPILIKTMEPERWKVLQVLPIKGQNDFHFEHFEITIQQFLEFKQVCLQDDLQFPIVFESNQEMKGTYVMVDPAGRFFDNSAGKHIYSDPILTTGVSIALKQVNYDYDGFILRGGIYNWK